MSDDLPPALRHLKLGSVAELTSWNGVVTVSDEYKPKRLEFDAPFLEPPEGLLADLKLTRAEFRAKAVMVRDDINARELEYPDTLSMLRAFTYRMGLASPDEELSKPEPLSPEDNARVNVEIAAARKRLSEEN